MVDRVADPAPAQLPRLDRIALAVGLCIMFVTYVWPPIGFTVAFAVFLPPALREVSLLKDVDRHVMLAARRAGLHAFLVLVALFLVSHGLVRGGVLIEDLSSATPILNESYLRGILVGTYLVSYLLQILGPRIGSFYVLIGVAILTLAPVPAASLGGKPPGLPQEGLLPIAALSALIASLALLVRARPYMCGWLLSGIFGAGAVLFVLFRRGDMPAASILSALLQMGLVFGCTGAVLLRSGRRQAL